MLTDDSGLVERTLYPLLPVIGPRHGSAVGRDHGRGARPATGGCWTTAERRSAASSLAADEFQLTARARPGHEVAEEGDLLVALDTQLTAELEAEGLAREVAHRLQGLRKAAGLEVSDRVVATIGGDEARRRPARPRIRDWLADEMLATHAATSARRRDLGPRPDEEVTLAEGTSAAWPSGAPEERHRVPSAHEQRGVAEPDAVAKLPSCCLTAARRPASPTRPARPPSSSTWRSGSRSR